VRRSDEQRPGLPAELFAWDPSGAPPVGLRGGRCAGCGAVAYPFSPFCPCEADAEVEAVELSRVGELVAWTAVHSPAPGFAAPYLVGYVDLPESVRLFAPLSTEEEGLLRRGAAMELEIEELEPEAPAKEAAARYTYRFRSASSSSGVRAASGAAVASAAGSAPHAGSLPRATARPALVATGAGACIAGVGMSAFVRSADRPIELLAQEAIVDAARDAGVRLADVERIYCGHVFQGRVAGQRVVRPLGLDGRPLVNVESACASGASALHLAVRDVVSGAAEVVLAFGLEQLSAIGRGVIPPDRHDIEGLLGRTNPATYALLAKAHMELHGTDLEDLAAVVVQARANGAANPRAQMREPTTASAVLGSPPVAVPLTRLQCCPTGDGASAAIVVSERAARRLGGAPVRVLASVVNGGQSRGAGDGLASHQVTQTTARAAYEAAACGPQDVDVVELHDAFSVALLAHAEDLGLYEPGAAARGVREAATAIDGRQPINPSGGLLARGHPLGASGLAQVFELVEQLRGRVGVRQVRDPRIALAHCEGGVLYGLDAGACAIHLLERMS
jgi:acetyl-CoA acetyltransferase/uncharacterized OB-fold protein